MHINEILRVIGWNHYGVTSANPADPIDEILLMDISPTFWKCSFNHHTGEVINLTFVEDVPNIGDVTFYSGPTIEGELMTHCSEQKMMEMLSGDYCQPPLEDIPLDISTEDLAMLDNAADVLHLSRNEFLLKAVLEKMHEVINDPSV